MKAEDIKAINDAAFALESVAHLRGLERELLPHAEALRKIADQQPPALDINETLYGNGPVPTERQLEQRIVWNLIKHLGEKGFEPAAVYDGDDWTKVDDGKAAMELIFNLDEAWLKFRGVSNEHSVFFVMGNGAEIISDWNYSEGDPDGFNAAAEAFDSEAFA